MIDFFDIIGYYISIIQVLRNGGARLKKCNKLAVFITVISAVAAVAVAVVAVVLFFEKKKKDEEELEHYLDCSIQ